MKSTDWIQCWTENTFLLMCRQHSSCLHNENTDLVHDSTCYNKQIHRANKPLQPDKRTLALRSQIPPLGRPAACQEPVLWNENEDILEKQDLRVSEEGESDQGYHVQGHLMLDVAMGWQMWTLSDLADWRCHYDGMSEGSETQRRGFLFLETNVPL